MMGNDCNGGRHGRFSFVCLLTRLIGPFGLFLFFRDLGVADFSVLGFAGGFARSSPCRDRLAGPFRSYRTAEGEPDSQAGPLRTHVLLFFSASRRRGVFASLRRRSSVDIRLASGHGLGPFPMFQTPA